MNKEIKIVIGSWGSYNECNERALGSSWLTLNDYNDWDEILDELKKQGFELDGIDEKNIITNAESAKSLIRVKKLHCQKNSLKISLLKSYITCLTNLKTSIILLLKL